jgi:outer membrane biosynthesis protein TonB
MTEATVSGASGASEPVARAPAPTTSDARSNDSAGQANSATVHVCVDEAGALKQEPTIVRSSGKPSLDQAAVKIAASGSAYYRPDSSSSGPPGSGCAQLTIRFEIK